MPTYKLITHTPQNREDLSTFERLVNDALKSGATLVGGVTIMNSDGFSTIPNFIYTQAVLYP